MKKSILFVGEYKFMDTWQILIRTLKEIDPDYVVEWHNIESRSLGKSLKEENYVLVIFIKTITINPSKTVLHVAYRKKPFMIVSEDSEEKVIKDLEIKDLDGGSDSFHYLEKSASFEEDTKNVANMIKEIL